MTGWILVMAMGLERDMMAPNPATVRATVTPPVSGTIQRSLEDLGAPVGALRRFAPEIIGALAFLLFVVVVIFLVTAYFRARTSRNSIYADQADDEDENHMGIVEIKCVYKLSQYYGEEVMGDQADESGGI